MGDIIVLTALGISVSLAISRLRKDRRKGGCCGNCSGCAGCCNTRQ